MSYSLNQLLSWMNEKKRMFEWGAIVALDRNRVNRLLTQEYIKRFMTDAYLRPINQSVDTTAITRYHFADYVLGTPRLSFENANLNDSKACLSLDVIGGWHLRLLKKEGQWTCTRIDRATPLLGPRLRLDLSLAEVPGIVSAGGLIYLDLSKSSNFTLLGFSPIEKDENDVGEYFGTLFKRLPDAQRIYPLGNIHEGSDPILRPESFILRTQAKSAAARDVRSADYGDGAIVGFICMESAHPGSVPVSTSDFRYLLPNDAGKNFTATVLTDLPRAVLSQMCQHIRTLLGATPFKITSRKGDNFVRATSHGGWLWMPAFTAKFKERMVKLSNPGSPTFYAEGQLSFKRFALRTREPMTLRIQGDEITLDWRVQGDARPKCDYIYLVPEGGTPSGDYSGNLRRNPFKMDTFHFNVVATYRFDSALGTIKLESLNVARTRSASEDAALGAVGSDPAMPPVINEIPWDELTAAQRLLILFNVYVVNLATYTKRYASKSINVVPAVKAQLEKSMAFNGSLTQFVQETIKLNFGEVIQGTEAHVKKDIGLFGQVNPALTDFAITPLEPIVAAGGKQKFSTMPVRENLKWTINGTSNYPGYIDLQGNYTAPPANLIENGMTQVRVTATNPVNNFSSSALLTVVADTLSIRPLVEILTPGEVLQLTAGTLKASDSLTWRILNSPKHGSLVGSTYTAPTFPDPVEGQPKPPAYVVDVVEVRNTQSGAVRTATIVTEKTLKIDFKIKDLNLQQGRLELQALINGEITDDAQWTLLHDGPGSISAGGVYLADPAREERFVLIESKEDSGKYGIHVGLYLLPLPLVDYAQTYDAIHSRI